MIHLAGRIVHRKRLFGHHQTFKSQAAILSHNHYIILIVLVLLIQVSDRYFYLHPILNQCQIPVEEVDVHQLRIGKFHQQNERQELNKNSYDFVIILHIPIFNMEIFVFVEQVN
jgi:hypothetical protein